MSRTKLSAVRRRERLCKKLVKHVAPKGMSYSQYVLACACNGVTVSLDNGMWLNWVFVNSTNSEFVQDMLLDALDKGYLLDFSNKEQIQYFIDAIPNLITNWRKWNIARLFRIVIGKWPNTDVANICSRFNNAFGFTFIS